MKFIILLFVLFSSIISFSQSSVIDSLNEVLAKETIDSSIAKVKAQLAYEWSYIDADTATIIYLDVIEYYKQAKNYPELNEICEELSKNFYYAGQLVEMRDFTLEYTNFFKETGCQDEYINTLGAYASALFSIGELKESLKNYSILINEADEAKESQKMTKSEAYVERSTIYSSNGNYFNAENDLSNALDMADTSDLMLISMINAMSGLNYMEINEEKLAEKHILRSLEIAKRSDESMLIVNAYQSLSVLYGKFDQYEKAEKYGVLGLKLAEELESEYAIMLMNKQLSEIYIIEEKYEELERVSNDYLTLAKSLELDVEVAHAKYLQGKVALDKKDFKRSQLKCEEAWDFFKNTNNNENKTSKIICECLAKSNAELGNYQDAYKFSTLNISFTDSLSREEEIQNTLRLKYSSDLTLQQNEFNIEKDELNQNIEIGKKIAKSQATTKWIFIIASIILILLLALLYKNFLQRKKAQLAVQDEKNHVSNILHYLVHEFRTPLSLIKGPIEDIKAGKAKENRVELIQRNANQMESLVGQFLDYAKYQAGRLPVQIEKANVKLITEDASRLFSALLTDRNIQIKIENKLDVQSANLDVDKYNKILQNLLSNAIKYSPENSTVKIVLERQQENLKITVIDHGKGMNEQEQKNLFKKFFRSKVNEEKVDGVGLGLAFTENLVKVLDGNIEVKSKLNEGTTFIVSLPTKFTSETEVIVSQSENQSQHLFQDGNATILIIDDNPDIRNYLDQTFTELNYNVLSAKNGEEGLKLAILEQPNFIISDIMMPEKNGYELTEVLKSKEETAHIPVLLLSAKTSVDSHRKGVELGADFYVKKPFSSYELKLIVENYLKTQREQERKLIATLTENTDAEKEIHPFLSEVKAVVLTDSSIAYTADELAAKMGMSRTKLHRKLKEITGTSTTEVVRVIKLIEAKKEIQKGNLNISEVAYQFGFNSPAYFTRCYKQYFNENPTDTKS